LPISRIEPSFLGSPVGKLINMHTRGFPSSVFKIRIRGQNKKTELRVAQFHMPVHTHTNFFKVTPNHFNITTCIAAVQSV
jgi:hypothetical protein